LSFILFFQYLGGHVPALGAFLVCLLVVAGWSFVVAKWAAHKANKRWRWDSEHNPKLMAQDIREGYDRRIAVLEERNTILQSRADQILPAFKALTDLAAYFVEQDKPGR
jgi:hypothetical protein